MTGRADGRKTRKKARNCKKNYLHSKLFYAILIELFVCTVYEQKNRGVAVSHVLNNSEVNIMREGIHPNYYQAKVVCNCGNEFVTGSTKKDIHVEICSKCHSFYTGQQKAASARGRIEMFNRKYGVK